MKTCTEMNCFTLADERARADYFERIAKDELNRRLRAVKAARKHIARIKQRDEVIRLLEKESLTYKYGWTNGFDYIPPEREFVEKYVLNAASAGCTGDTVTLARYAWNRLQEIKE